MHFTAASRTLPHHLHFHSTGDLSFSKRHSEGRNLDDLLRVITPGKVTFHCPSVTTTQDYEFSNIGHLALHMIGPFTTHHSFKAPVLTLDTLDLLTWGSVEEPPGGRMMMQIVGAFAEFERAMLRERTRNGLDAARKQGRIGGRRPKLNTHQQMEILHLVTSSQKSAADAARLFNVHPSTVSRLLQHSTSTT